MACLQSWSNFQVEGPEILWEHFLRYGNVNNQLCEILLVVILITTCIHEKESYIV